MNFLRFLAVLEPCDRPAACLIEARPRFRVVDFLFARTRQSLPLRACPRHCVDGFVAAQRFYPFAERQAHCADRVLTFYFRPLFREDPLVRVNRRVRRRHHRAEAADRVLVDFEFR